MMNRVIDICRSQGIRRIHGDVLRENTRMLKFCEKLGFTSKADPDDRSIVHVELRLDGA
jgi:acetyltransferase